MGVRNDETDGFDEITGVSANINPGPFNRARFGGAFSDGPAGHIACNPGSGLTIKCATFPTERDPSTRSTTTSSIPRETVSISIHWLRATELEC